MSSVAGSELQPGTTVAGYRIEALIGRGGMGHRASAAGERGGVSSVAGSELQPERRLER